MALEELGSVLCIALAIALAVFFWTSYKRTIAELKSWRDYSAKQREDMKRHERLMNESERQTVQHSKLLERQESILSRVENLVTLVEKKFATEKPGDPLSQ